MTFVIGISGRCNSGKTTTSNFILGQALSSLSICRGIWSNEPDGKLHISDLYGDVSHNGVFDVKRSSEAFVRFRKDKIDPFIKFYSFADPLKEDVCVNILGLCRDLVYGSQEDKNSPSGLFWKDMPGVCCDISYKDNAVQEVCGLLLEECVEYHENAELTVRDVLDYVGSKIFRRMVPDCWVKATLKRIETDKPEIAVLDDCRWSNEILGIKGKEGVSIRLTRNGNVKTELVSETGLDKENFDWANFSYVVDNGDLTISETNALVYEVLKDLGLFSD